MSLNLQNEAALRLQRGGTRHGMNASALFGRSCRLLDSPANRGRRFGLKIPRAAPDVSCTMSIPKRTTTGARARGSATRDRRGKSSTGMHTCPTCSSNLVQPANWHEQGDGCWNVELRCPECEWRGRDSYSQSEVDAYDEELDCGGRELTEDLRDLTRANMEDEANRFAMALASDSILPEDF
jgi:hypothetical protein